jgi:hypothetical protein
MPERRAYGWQRYGALGEYMVADVSTCILLPEFLTYEDGIVYIKMLGACANCVAQDETVRSGIEMILVDEVPGVLHVKVVSE